MKPLLLAGWLAAFGGDIYTTNRGLAQGAREWTLPTQRPLVINSILVAEGTLGYLGYRRLHRTRPKLALTLYIVAVAAHGTATIWNARQLR